MGAALKRMDEQARSIEPSSGEIALAGLHEEVGRFPASWILELPWPVTLALHVPGVTGIVRAARTGESVREALEAGELVLDAAEWRALVAGAEADRIWPQDLRAFCQRKRDEPAWRLAQEEALAGAQPDHDERWTLARVLARVGVELVGVDMEGPA